MADLYVNKDTNLGHLPLNVVPLVSDADFKTLITTLSPLPSGFSLRWNFLTTTGVQTQTLVTPTTGGAYDITNLGGGMFAIEMPAEGGASINNNQTGIGWFTGTATGILPWRGPLVAFRAQQINNSLLNDSDITVGNVTGNVSGDVSGNVGGIAGTYNNLGALYTAITAYGDGAGRWGQAPPAAEGVVQTGSSTTQIVLDPATLGGTNHYTDFFIEIYHANGLQDGGYISTYNATTKTATLVEPLSTAPSTTATYKIYVSEIAAGSGGSGPSAADITSALLSTALTPTAASVTGTPTVGQMLMMTGAALGLFKMTVVGTTITVYAPNQTTVLMQWTTDSATAPTTRTRAV